MRKLIFLSIYFFTGISMLLFTLSATGLICQRTLIILIAFFFTVALKDHYKEIRS